jgi:predicted transcriptional regulator
MNEKIKLLMHFGLTENEARVYLTMLQIKPTTGYQISKRSGISRSKIYSILASLVEKNYVLQSEDKSAIYAPVAINEIIESLKKQSQINIEKLQQSLGRLTVEQTDTSIWQLPDYQQVIEKATFQIEHAQKSLYVQIYSEDLSEELIAALTAAQNRLHEFVVILFSQHQHYKLPFRRFYKHYFAADKVLDYGGRWLNVVADGQAAVFGRLPEDSLQTGVVYTQNPSMIFLAQEYVLHDAYCLRTLQQLHGPAQKVFGKDLEGVRKIYFNKG